MLLRSAYLRPAFLGICAWAAFVLLLAACGGDDGGAGADASAAVASPGAQEEPAATPTAVTLRGRCAMGTNVPPEYELELEAHWKGERIIVEGSVKLPGPATVSWFVCQNGLPSASFVFVGEPKLDDGKIRGASQVYENPRSRLAPFDPDGAFTLVVFAQDPDFGIPYFMVAVPVEGKPD